MGVVVSYFFGYPDDNVVDPKTGLTGHQKRLVKNTWAIVRADSVGAGVTIMTRFFKEYPQYQKVFPAFRDRPLDELPGDKKFQAHCLSIVGILSNALDALDDAGLMEATLIVTGERHGRRGQGRQEFIDLRGVMMKVLEEALASKFTPEVALAWDKTIDLLFEKIFEGLKNGRSEKM